MTPLAQTREPEPTLIDQMFLSNDELAALPREDLEMFTHALQMRLKGMVRDIKSAAERADPYEPEGVAKDSDVYYPMKCGGMTSKLRCAQLDMQGAVRLVEKLLPQEASYARAALSNNSQHSLGKET